MTLSVGSETAAYGHLLVDLRYIQFDTSTEVIYPITHTR